MSASDLDTLYTAAVTALDAGDYAAAILAAQKVRLRLVTTPNMTHGLAGSNRQISWQSARDVDAFIATCRALQRSDAAASSGPFRQSAVTYDRPTS